MKEEAISIWQVLIVLVFPTMGVAFWLLWGRTTELWAALDTHQENDHAFHLEAERRFVNVSALGEIKKDLDQRLDKMDAKLERLLEGRLAGEH